MHCEVLEARILSPPQLSRHRHLKYQVSVLAGDACCWVCVTWGGFNWWKHSSSPPPVLPSPAHMETPWYTLLTTLTHLSRGGDCLHVTLLLILLGKGAITNIKNNTSLPHPYTTRLMIWTNVYHSLKWGLMSPATSWHWSLSNIKLWGCEMRRIVWPGESSFWYILHCA